MKSKANNSYSIAMTIIALILAALFGVFLNKPVQNAKQINAIKDKHIEVVKDIADLQAKFSDIKEDVKDIKSDIKVIHREINQINQNIAKLVKK